MMAFKLEGATKRVGGRTALSGVSLALPAGAALGLPGILVATGKGEIEARRLGSLAEMALDSVVETAAACAAAVDRILAAHAQGR